MNEKELTEYLFKELEASNFVLKKEIEKIKRKNKKILLIIFILLIAKEVIFWRLI